MLIMARSFQEALQHAANLIYLLLALGFQVNFSKSEPQLLQVLEFLGFQISSIAMTLELPTDKVHRTLTTCRNLIDQRQGTARRLASILELISSAALSILPAFRSSIGGFVLVALAPGRAQRALYSSASSRPGHADGCSINSRLGSSQWSSPFIRTLDTGGEAHSYQLLGTTGSLLWSTITSKGS